MFENMIIVVLVSFILGEMRDFFIVWIQAFPLKLVSKF